ncbi:sugar transferase [Periweissella beninensis]|uniref:Sugar transferase n=1 Tax=Periweissella beninensis TaxID=504936 RepID=A0ABT0VG46_9LACO|nr:sugar transferase [Periweissella beninensis]MCM2436666.1 sugar transferase [Periweissella beninensis]MCT4395636.1 sugar transferase [Periweissella beninensis]
MQVQSITYLFFKRIVDIILSLIALFLLSPIFIIIIGLYKFADPHQSVFYKQRRVGKHHKMFYIYKFRTMIPNADAVLHADKALYAKFVANGYKLPTAEDPRITKFGAWLRKSSVDEIPQFINVLKGEMSIVGPRPIVEDELVEYGNNVNVFLSVKPGAMGLWQATGRSNIEYPERADLELSYVQDASFWFDCKIMFMTLISIIKSDGAF